jgi:hypothetical protein
MRNPYPEATIEARDFAEEVGEREHDERVQRELDDAADVLRANEDAWKRQQAPIPQACHHCSHKYAGAICPLCKTERPAFTALKAQRKTAALPDPLPFCEIYPKSLCGCGLRKLCLEAA